MTYQGESLQFVNATSSQEGTICMSIMLVYKCSLFQLDFLTSIHLLLVQFITIGQVKYMIKSLGGILPGFNFPIPQFTS